MEKTAIELAKEAIALHDEDAPEHKLGQAILSLSADLERMREALEQCSADWRSPPCTVEQGATYLFQEFARRAEVARAALGSTG